IDPRGVKQLQPIELGRGESPLMRKYLSGREFLQAQSYNKPVARIVPSLSAEVLRVQMDSRRGWTHQDSVPDPLFEHQRSRAVAVRLAAEFQPHDVEGAAFVKLRLTLRVD